MLVSAEKKYVTKLNFRDYFAGNVSNNDDVSFSFGYAPTPVINLLIKDSKEEEN